MALDQTTTAGDVPGSTLERRAVEVFERLGNGEFEYIEHRFAANELDLPASEMPDMWEQVTALFGEFEAVTVVDEPVCPDKFEDENDTATGVHLRIELQGGTFGSAIGFDETGLIERFQFAKADDDSPLGTVKTALKAGQLAANQAIGDGLATVREQLPGFDSGPTTPAERREFAVEIVNLLAAGEYQAVHETFGPEFKQMLTVDELKATCIGGDFDVTENVEYDAEDDAVYVTCQDEDNDPFDTGDGRVQYLISYDEYGRVTGLMLQPPEAGKISDYEQPAYVDDDAFIQRDFAVGEDGALEGVLTVPRGVGPHPAAVIVHGSGTSDRNGTGGANRPYQDIGQGLASRGVATLRYDKRPLSDETLAPEDRVVTDAVDAVRRLKDDPAIDADSVVVLGHSLGAELAPRIAAEGETAGAVGLAAPSGDMLGTLVEQVRTLEARDIGDKSVDQAERAVERVRQGDVDPDEELFGYPGAFWQWLDDYDPARPLSENAVEMLVCHAGHDWKVSDEEFARWQRLADTHPVTTWRYEECNHTFIPVDGDEDVFEAGRTTGHPTENVIEDVANWITDLNNGSA